MNTDEHRLKQLTDKILAAAFEVSNTLGSGFLEKVYERALLKELVCRAVRAETQVPFQVLYKAQIVGEYFADILVEDAVVIELKCVERLAPEHMAQCINYLRASGLGLCLLFNFQKAKLEWKRIIL